MDELFDTAYVVWVLNKRLCCHAQLRLPGLDISEFVRRTIKGLIVILMLNCTTPASTGIGIFPEDM